MPYPDNFRTADLDRFWGADNHEGDHATLDAMFAEVDRCKQRLQALATALPREVMTEALGAASALDDVADDFLKPARSLLASMEQEPV